MRRVLQGISKAYRRTLTMPAWCRVSAMGLVDPGVSGSSVVRSGSVSCRPRFPIGVADAGIEQDIPVVRTHQLHDPGDLDPGFDRSPLSMVPCCRGGEHATSRRGRTRIIAIPAVEVEVAVSVVPRRCGCARKHSRGREYQKSKFPCHDRGSSALTSDEIIDQSAGCSKRRSRKNAGCVRRGLVPIRPACPAVRPIEQASKFWLVVNLKTAKQLGIAVPPNVPTLADEG
jgi:hypothetical protein